MSPVGIVGIDAAQLSDWQSCKRKYLIGKKWALRKWRPKALADSLLRKGIWTLSQGGDPLRTAVAARTRLLEIAVEPGLDMVRDPYKVGHDYGALVEIILRYLGAAGVPKLMEPPYIPALEPVGPAGLDWRFRAWADEAGLLHRWITVERWDDDALHREAHSWWTIGDVVAARAPMVLHAIEVGSVRDGRHSCVWTRAYEHPSMPWLPPKFVKPPDTSWKPLYYLDQNRYNAGEWLALAARERAFEARVHELRIECPSERLCDEITSQIKTEQSFMAQLDGDWSGLPMSRGACDLFYPCAYQQICYDTSRTPIEKMGLYVRRETQKNGG
jgi:hypothetical protein